MCVCVCARMILRTLSLLLVVVCFNVFGVFWCVLVSFGVFCKLFRLLVFFVLFAWVLFHIGVFIVEVV